MPNTVQTANGDVGTQVPKTVLVLNDGVGGRAKRRVLDPEMQGAMDVGQAYGWRMIDPRQWSGDLPAGVVPDGLIADRTSSYGDVVKRWYPQVPVGVVIDREMLHKGPYAVVQTDLVMIGDRAADYFLERQFRHFAACHYGEKDRTRAVREFEDRVAASSGDCFMIACPPTGEEAGASYAQSIQRQIAEMPLPLAIFCTNDRLAVRISHWCLDMGLDIPEQVAILGLGNAPASCRYNPVPLSSIDLVPERRGAEAARLLQRMMEGEPVPDEPVHVPVGGVVTRRSTDILAIPDRDVARALRYMWDHYREDIGLDRIAAACGISRSKLAQHFRKSLNRTVVQELTRYRLHEARRLLIAGDAPVADIAVKVGFSRTQYFHKVFKRAFALTPQEYRKRARHPTGHSR